MAVVMVSVYPGGCGQVFVTRDSPVYYFNTLPSVR